MGEDGTKPSEVLAPRDPFKHLPKRACEKKGDRKIQLKSSLVVIGLLGILAIGGYLGLHSAHPSPPIVEKRAEGPAGPADLSEITGLAGSRDGHMLVTVNGNKTVSLWDAASGTNLRTFESSPTEWIYAPTFSPDGSLLATPSSTPYTTSSGHLLLWDTARGSDSPAWMISPGLYAALASTPQER